MTMHLSDEQMAAVRHGIKAEVSWEEISLPRGPQPVPEWAKDLHVDFMDGFGNSPHFTIKGSCNLRRWPDKRFTRDGDRFMAISPDGRAEIYYQGGKLTQTTIRMFKGCDGELRQYPRTGAEWGNPTDGLAWIYPNGERHGTEPGEWVEVERLCTQQENGFGGSHIHITMEDGTPVVLRGPWHGGSPNGFVEVAYADASDPNFARQSAWWRKTLRKNGYTHRHHWGTCTGGLFVREAEFILIFARFLPHLRLMRLIRNERSFIEPLKPDWDAPKCVIQQRERDARQQRAKVSA